MATLRDERAMRAVLEADPWFARLGAVTRAELLRCARARRCGRGEAVFQRDDVAESLWVCGAGAVRLGWSSAQGERRFNFAYLPAGSWFGEAALHEGAVHEYDAHAQGRALVLQVPRADVLRLAGADPSLRHALLQLAARRVAAAQELLQDTRGVPIVPRLAKTLLVLARDHGPSGTGHALRLPQDRLAESLGISRQSVNKALKGIERHGAIEVRSLGVVVRDAHALLDIARHG